MARAPKITPRGQYAESKDERRSIRLVIRVNEKELAEIKAYATKERKGNVGWYCRDRALKKL